LCGVRARGVRRPATPPPLYLDKQTESMERASQLHAATLCHAHYGWQSGADALLSSHLEQLLAWKDTVARGLKEGRSVDQIARELLETDPLLAGLPNLTPMQQKREIYFTKNAVAGLAGYIERGRPLP